MTGDPRRCLVTGASGYIGSRLVVALDRAGHHVVATARDVAKLAAFDWSDDVVELSLDVADPDSCSRALREAGEVEVAYFLVHSIGEGDFAEQDLESAREFAAAAAAAGVQRIVYLGGFVPHEDLSEHLESRSEVGEALGGTVVELVWLRAAIILGGGSTSYELVRHIADRTPVIPLPTWMDHPVSPIAVADVLHYLVAAAGAGLPAGAYDISNGERPTYAELIRAYADEAGLRRWWFPFPPVPPRLVATIASWLTPLPHELAADLIMSLPNDMDSHDHRIRELVPDPDAGLTTTRDALATARAGSGAGGVGSSDPAHRVRTDPDWSRQGHRRCGRGALVHGDAPDGQAEPRGVSARETEQQATVTSPPAPGRHRPCSTLVLSDPGTSLGAALDERADERQGA